MLDLRSTGDHQRCMPTVCCISRIVKRVQPDDVGQIKDGIHRDQTQATLCGPAIKAASSRSAQAEYKRKKILFC